MKYKAFISYSHRDSKWGEWLHKSLETYRVPKALVGTPGREGVLENRLGRVFRDRDELPTSHDLNTAIIDALKQSDYLVVICSRESSRSRWVNQEIIEYKKLHGEERILAFIVDGEPNATDRGSADEECFPPALRFTVGPDGLVSDERTEPIAADARSQGDRAPNAKLKLIAGLLGVDYDALRQREKKRQHQRLAILSGAFMLMALLFIGFIVQSGRATIAGAESKEQRERAENLKEKWIAEGAKASPLIEAVVWGDPEDVVKEIERGADLNAAWGPDKLTPLMMASKVGHLEVLRLLLEKGADASLTDGRGLQAIHHVANDGNASVLDVFAEFDIDLDTRATGQTTETARPIDIAAGEGHIGVVEKLVALGVPIERIDDDPMSFDSPLFAASFYGRVESVRTLLKLGANANVGHLMGTPYEVAKLNGRTQIANLLSEFTKPVELEATGEKLYEIVITGLLEDPQATIKDMVARGADLDYIHPETGYTILATAVMMTSLNGSIVDEVDKETAQDIISANQRSVLAIEALLDVGADPNTTDPRAKPILVTAAENGSTEIVKLLIEKGANINARGRLGESALGNARSRQQTECVRILLEAGAM